MRVLVAGANGFVGSSLIPALQEQGHQVVALDRDPYDGPCERAVQADLTDYNSVADEFEDVDVVYYLVHSMGSWGDFSATEQRCATNVRKACDAHGVDRIIYLTGIIPDSQLSRHLASRQNVGKVLSLGDAAVTELRAAIILGEGSASFRIMRQLVERLPVMVAPRWLSSRCQPIHIDDVVHYLTAVLDRDATRGEWYDIGGPDIDTYRGLLATLADELGRTPRFLPAPVLTPRLSSYWLRLVTDVPYPLTRALVESLRDDMVVGEPIDSVVAHECMGYREAVRAILA